MPKSLQQGDADLHQHAMVSRERFLRWDDLRVLVACSNAPSFRRAGTVLNMSSATVVRRIQRLEQDMGVTLFHRLPDGIALTQNGLSIVRSANEMQRALYDVIRDCDLATTQRTPISVSVTEGLGTYWIIPQLASFQRQHPDLLVNLRCAMSSADVLRHEADISIQLTKPESPELKCVRLGWLNIYTYASSDYVRTFGKPRSAADVVHHRLIDQVAPQLDRSAWARYLGRDNIDELVALVTNTSTAVLFGVECGAGIGALPTYVGAMNPSLVPVELDIRHQIEIWLTFHPQLRENSRKSFLIDWIRSIFDPRQYPFFAEAFIVPPDPSLNVPLDFALPTQHPLAQR